MYAILIWSAFLGQAVSYSKFYFFHLVLAAAIPFYIFSFCEGFPKVSSAGLRRSWFLFFLTAWSIISFSFADDRGAAAIGLGQFLCGVGIMFFWNQLKRKDLVVGGLLFLLFGHLILGLLEAFTPLRWPISAVSPYSVFFGKAATTLPVTYEDYPTGFFWHPNNGSFVLLVATPLIFAARALSRPVKFIYAVLTIVFCVKAGAKAQLILFFAYSFFAALKYRSFVRLKVKTMLLVLVGCSLTTAALVGSLNVDQRKELRASVGAVRAYGHGMLLVLKGEPSTKISSSINERFRFIVAALAEVRANPLTGMGIGQNQKSVSVIDGIPTPLKSIHHYWIELLMIGGVSLFLPFMVFLMHLTWRCLKSGRGYGVEALMLFFFGVLSISSGTYFLPQWILYALLDDDEGNQFFR